MCPPPHTHTHTTKPNGCQSILHNKIRFVEMCCSKFLHSLPFRSPQFPVRPSVRPSSIEKDTQLGTIAHSVCAELVYLAIHALPWSTASTVQTTRTCHIRADNFILYFPIPFLRPEPRPETSVHCVQCPCPCQAGCLSILLFLRVRSRVFLVRLCNCGP